MEIAESPDELEIPQNDKLNKIMSFKEILKARLISKSPFIIMTLINNECFYLLKGLVLFESLFAISARIKINATKAYTEINLSLKKVVTGITDLNFLILNSH